MANEPLTAWKTSGTFAIFWPTAPSLPRMNSSRRARRSKLILKLVFSVSFQLDSSRLFHPSSIQRSVSVSSWNW